VRTRIWIHTPTRTSSRTLVRTRIHMQTRIRTSSATRTAIRTPATTTTGLRIGPDSESRSADPSPGWSPCRRGVARSLYVLCGNVALTLRCVSWNSLEPNQVVPVNTRALALNRKVNYWRFCSCEFKKLNNYTNNWLLQTKYEYLVMISLHVDSEVVAVVVVAATKTYQYTELKQQYHRRLYSHKGTLYS